MTNRLGPLPRTFKRLSATVQYFSQTFITRPKVLLAGHRLLLLILSILFISSQRILAMVLFGSRICDSMIKRRSTGVSLYEFVADFRVLFFGAERALGTGASGGALWSKIFKIFENPQ